VQVNKQFKLRTAYSLNYVFILSPFLPVEF
jgi:hypothetical protein